MRSSMPCLAALLLVACGDFKVVRVGYPTLSDTLTGEWTGSWRSGEMATVGELRLEVQEFAGQPVVLLQLDNPCLTPGDYDLALRAEHIELSQAGAVVMRLQLPKDGTMVGTYDCAADSGTMVLAWQRDLPVPIDLSGFWQGDLSWTGHAPLPLTIHLEQSVRNGSLGLVGVLMLPSLSVSVPVEGRVRFRDLGFDLLLTSLPGAMPELLLTGFGNRAPLQVQFGVLLTFAATLPFTEAVVHIARAPQ